MRVANEDVVLMIKQTVIVDGIWSLVEGFVEDKGVDCGLAGQNDIVSRDLLRGQF